MAKRAIHVRPRPLLMTALLTEKGSQKQAGKRRQHWQLRRGNGHSMGTRAGSRPASRREDLGGVLGASGVP